MLSPVAVAGCAINLLVALILLYMRFGRSGRDWLDLFAIAHAASGFAYATLIPFESAETLTAFLAGPWSTAHSLLRIAAFSAALGGMMRLIYRLPGWRVTFIAGGLSIVAAAGFALLASQYVSFQAVIGLTTLAFFALAAMTWRGPTAFYFLLGITWLLRGAMGIGLAYTSSIAGAEALFQTMGILNVIFISATGFAICLIELDDARLASEEASQAKTQFIANMSHELRTPLNAIIGFAELLEGRVFKPTGDQTRQYATLIEGAGRHLLGVINALLDMASIEARREHLHFEKVEVNQLAASATKMLATEAAGKSVTLRLNGTGRPVEAMTDPRAMRQILLNLIANAVKFSPSGSAVDVTCSHDAQRNCCRISVRDHGPGIGPDDQQRIFEPFWQAGDTFNRAHGGVGLGLAIAQRLALALGATLSVDSVKGEGSTFTITLPLAPARPERELIETRTAA